MTKKKELREREINRVMRNFDFEKVVRVMTALDWHYVRGVDLETGKYTAYRPTIAELKKSARKHLKTLDMPLLNGDTAAESHGGGFIAFHDRETGGIGLRFAAVTYSDCPR